ncbi:MAG: preprotein translocase subunit SecA [Candidatus Oxydemutatoraceae bacterium WSBS_2016_MAG_OTU14]
MLQFIRRLFPSRNQRQIKQYQSTVKKINALADTYRVFSDDELRSQTAKLKQRVENGEKADAILPDAFAVVRETADRCLKLRHFDVQLVGGMVLNDGKIAEMGTGEGKTLVATLPAYLNAVMGHKVHIITVNDYLAQRDAEWMGEIYTFLNLSIGIVISGQDGPARKKMYEADIVYGTNNEFGFDYLRDNMAVVDEQRVQSSLDFAIIDEVDSILVDEARTPLIISGPANDASKRYKQINQLVKKLYPEKEEGDGGHYSLDEKSKHVFLTEEGHQKVEELLEEADLLDGGDLYALANLGLLHHVNAALRARGMFKKNVDYLVRNGEVLIVDEFTGRVMTGRRWGEGLHQAIEAKEGVRISSENQTLASITFQNYFRLYGKLSGMTGTADTEAYEFQDIYNLEVVIVPTNRETKRDDFPDVVYMTITEKYEAIVEDIQECNERGQPILVGTASIDTSEKLSSLLKKSQIKHEVLNAKHHEKESGIIANAGCAGAVTIATNMAGRGTDIVLGGAILEGQEEVWQLNHEKVLVLGGLHIIGTERHESRRIDNQLRGRSGRQGDPGSSRFFLSLEDNLLRIFSGDRVRSIIEKFGAEPGDAIEHPWVSRAIENAQRKVEAHNFDMRKSLLEYDDTANEQRQVIYNQRNEILSADEISDNTKEILPPLMGWIVQKYMPSYGADWDMDGLKEEMEDKFALQFDWDENEEQDLTEVSITNKLIDCAEKTYHKYETKFGHDAFHAAEKILMLQVIDFQWKEHLIAMDHLRQGIGLRGFAQKNPKQEYKRESFEMFQRLLEMIRYYFISHLFRINRLEEIQQEEAEAGNVSYQHANAENVLQSPRGEPNQSPKSAEAAHEFSPSSIEKTQPVHREEPKIGRNDPCFCGSGKKYKKCHGRIDIQEPPNE